MTGYSLKPELTEKRIIVNRWKAWQECDLCGGDGEELTDVGAPCGTPMPHTCRKCHGEGGWWHPKVYEAQLHRMEHPEAKADGCPLCVEKSSILIQSGEVCERCEGKGEVFGLAPRWYASCPDCHNGINPSTERWEVSDGA